MLHWIGAALVSSCLGLAPTIVTAQPHEPGTVPYFLSEPLSIGVRFGGVGLQAEGSVWQVVLFRDALGGLTLDYPDLKCGGSPDIVHSTANHLVLTERIERGLENCYSGSKVVIRTAAFGAVDIVWCGQNESENAAAILFKDGLEKQTAKELLDQTAARFPAKMLDELVKRECDRSLPKSE
ncbi:MAG: hypothetical protein AAFU56_12130 [Pseudomonadota bacterium]